VSVLSGESSQSRAVEIYPKSGRTMVRGVAGPYSVAEGGVHVEGFCKIIIIIIINLFLSFLWSLLFGRRYSRLEREASDNQGKKVWSTKKCGSFHVADDRKLGVT
jgi:hypothetical protein